MRTSLIGLSILLALPLSASAQQVRTSSVVTHEGVFTVEVETSGTVKPFTTTTVSNPNPTAPGARWIYPNTADLPWITESVGVGNFGTMDWLGENLNGERLSLVSPTDDQSPALPIYEDLAPTTESVSIQVAAADKATSCAAAWRNSTTGVNEIRLYSGFSPTPATLAAPVQEIRISDDGTRIAAGYADVANNAAVTVYDETLLPLITVTGAGSTFRHHDISGDGSTVLLASGTTNFVYDVATGGLLHQDGSTVSHDAHSIDNDGDTWGRGGFDVGVWKESGGVYTRILTYTDPAFGFGVFDACDVSADGSTFVVAGRDATTNAHFRVYCFALSSTGAQLLWRYVNLGGGSLQDVAQEVSVSDDGRKIAVGSWGAQTGGHPEVLVFDRDLGNVPIASIDTPGSCFSVDLSGDGQFVVAGTKAVHANINGNGGEGYSHDLGDQGFWLQGTPSLGRTITLNFNGAPGDLAFISASLDLLPAPLTIFPYAGDWWLDPAFLFLPPLAVAPIPASGTLSVPVLLPLGPGIGVEIFTQAARSGPNPAIDNYLRLPITP